MLRYAHCLAGHTIRTKKADYEMMWIGSQLPKEAGQSQLRVANWNVGGGLLSVTPLSGQHSKLQVVISYMRVNGIKLIAIEEAGCTLSCMQKALPSGFKAYGHPTKGLVFWLVHPDWTSNINARGVDPTGRSVTIRLAGKNGERQLAMAMYGYSSATSSKEVLALQDSLFQRAEKLLDRKVRYDKTCIVVGDINQAMRSRDSASSTTNSIHRLQEFSQGLGLTSAFIHVAGHIHRNDGAFTLDRSSRGITSLIDHILAESRNVVGCAIDSDAPRISDHRPLVADLHTDISGGKGHIQREKLSEQIFDHWSNYSLQTLRQWEDAEMDSLLEKVTMAAEGSTAHTMNELWGATTQVMQKMADATMKKSREGQSSEKKAYWKIINRVTDKWTKAIEVTKTCLKSEKLLKNDSRDIYRIMWGGKSKAEVHKWMEAWQIDDIDMPDCQIKSKSKFSTLWEQERRKEKIEQWREWIRTIITARQKLHNSQRRRSNKWWKWMRKMTYKQDKINNDEGYTSNLFKNIFPEETATESCSFSEGDNWITEPIEVANKVKDHMYGLSAENEWNRPYNPEEGSSTKFQSGPWAGQPRANFQLLYHIHSNKCHKCYKQLQDTMKPIPFDEYVERIGKKSTDSSPGFSGLSYGLLRSVPVKFQKICWQWRNWVTRTQEVPNKMTDLPIIALPKNNGLMAGYTNTRPISLYEVIFKMITGSIHYKVSAVLQEYSILHPMQFFGQKGLGVIDALQLVIQSLELAIRSGKKVVVKSADVAAAFPSVRHWHLQMIMEGYGFPKAVTRFFQLADAHGTFKVRLKQAWSDSILKPPGGVGQGEQGSPPKYILDIDVLLWILEDYCELGIWVGEGYNDHCRKHFPMLQPLTMKGWLVGFLFCDDLAMVAGDEDDMQTLINVVTSVHDLPGSKLVAYKSFAGSSMPRKAPTIHISMGRNEPKEIMQTIYQWSQDSGHEGLNIQRQGNSFAIKANTKLLDMLGDKIFRQGIEGAMEPNADTLLGRLEQQGWTGHCVVKDRPLYVLDVRTGAIWCLPTGRGHACPCVLRRTL